MARCSNCNKFVSLELGDPEFEPEIDEELVTGELRLVLSCVDCGTEIKEATETVEIDVSSFKHNKKSCTGQLKIEDSSSDSIDEFKGKTHIFGADITVDIACPKCEASKTYEESVKIPSGEFEDL